MSTELQLRPATREDLAAVADLHLRVREAAVPSMPPITFTASEVRDYVERWDLQTHHLWLAVADDRPLGYAMVHADWLHSLYVDPDAQSQGIGTALIELAKSLRPGGFSLYVFASNRPARDFYARRGLVELETTDGTSNPERAPDVRMAWPGEDPLAFFRSRIDEVDLALGDALARRAALTRAVQDHKRADSVVSDPARDEEREREIVERVLQAAPELGRDRVATIMHTIITASLDASRE